MSIEDLIKKELKKLEKEEWKPSVQTYYKVRIKRGDEYFWNTYTPREEGTMECMTTEQIKTLAQNKEDAVFKHVIINIRIK